MQGFTAALKSTIKRTLPRGLNIGPAVVQLFLNDGRKTRLGLSNFPSFLSPVSAADYRYELSAFDEEGREAASVLVDVPRYASVDLDMSAAFGSRLPSLGMVSARIIPVRYFSLSDRHLGRIRPQVFALYASERMESVGLVHPQTSLGAAPALDRRWVSNLEIEPATIDHIELFQVNPGDAWVQSEAFVQGPDGTMLARCSNRIPPRGTRRAVFELASLAGRHKTVSVGLNGLAAANGKPILFLHFRDASFTCCHA
jgi:hypothetical protein